MRIKADVEKVIATARAELGVSEKPAFSNRTPYTAWYGLVGPWCAMFVSWCFWHAGSPLPAIRTRKGFSYCPDIVNWAKQNGIWHSSSSSYKPKRGDIVLYDFIGRPSHVGIVLGVLADGRIVAIEGNTSGGGGRDGGSVVIHNRSRKGSTIGFVEVDNTKAPAPAPDKPKTGFAPGDSGPGVKLVQGMVNVCARYRINAAGNVGGARIREDGDFGDQTEAAVTEFQRYVNRQLFFQGKTTGIREDGVVDQVTLFLLAETVKVARPG